MLIKLSQNVHYDTEQIRKDSKNIFNRLKSIFEDAKFVNEISDLLPYLSVVANERCGTWYVDPLKLGIQTVYFKSTDGHTGKWAFNLRRLNAHLFDIIIKHGGCIIVDSTRHGKRIPDSQSKTIPIWCCTINNAIKKFRDSITFDAKLSEQTEQFKESFTWNDKFDSKIEWDTEFHSLPSLISKSEHDQIASLIPQFTQNLLDSGFDMHTLSNKLKKSLRPLWFTPSSNIFLHDLPDYTAMSFYPVICLNASQMIESGVERRQGFLYVQGSADDHEMWAKGLTPSLFWKYNKEILNTNNVNECEKIVSQIIQQEKITKSELNDFELSNDSFNFIGNTNIAIGNYKSAFPPECWKNFDYIINCTPDSYTSDEIIPHNKNYLQLPIPEGKKGQKILYSNIPIAIEFIKKPLEENKKILIHCRQGIDRSCGIALAIMVKYFDDEGNFIKDGVNNQNIRKENIQNKLLYITSFRVKANPTKATLKKINMYFMS